MAVIQVTHDTPQVYDNDINQPTVTLECSVTGFHVYMRVTRGTAIFGWKVMADAPPITKNLIRHDQVLIELPCGTGTMTVNRL